MTLSLTSPRGEARLLEVVVLDFTIPSISHLLSCIENILFKTQQQNQPTPYFFHIFPLTPNPHPTIKYLIKDQQAEIGTSAHEHTQGKERALLGVGKSPGVGSPACVPTLPH